MKSRVLWVVVALVVVGGGAYAAWTYGLFGKSEEPVVVAAKPAPVPAAKAPAPVAAKTDAAPAGPAAPAKGTVAANVKSTPPANAAAPATVRPGVTATAASGEGAGAPVVTAVPQASQEPGSGLAHLDDHLSYQYNALGRRDPFQSLVDGNFVGADVGGDAPPDPGGIKVVGIVWGSTDQFALVEDVRGNSFVLRKGDKVQNGYVEGLKRDGLIVAITADGQSQSVMIPLVRKGDQNAR
jgi:hypothetical protein